MRTALLVAVLLVLPMQEPERYPGQRNHAEPPAGWTCVHQNIELSVPADHACNCERMCDSDTGLVIEDKSCTVWCWASHCKCDMSNASACK